MDYQQQLWSVLATDQYGSTFIVETMFSFKECRKKLKQLANSNPHLHSFRMTGHQVAIPEENVSLILNLKATVGDA